MRDLQGWYFHFIHSVLSGCTAVTELYIVDDYTLQLTVPRTVSVKFSSACFTNVETRGMSLFNNVDLGLVLTVH